MASYVSIQSHRGIASVTLSRPDVHNAFNDEMIAEIHAAFDELAGRDDVRVIVLRAEGKSFSAGGDLNWMKRMVEYTFAENVADATALSEMYLAIRNCPKPVIARVHGSAFGGGVGLVASCDIAVALASAQFALTEVKLGILPAVISPYVMEKIGVSAARRYMLTAERFGAAEAHRIGLIHEVCATEAELDAKVDELAEAIKQNGPEAIAHCKQLIRDVAAGDWPTVMTITAQRIAERRASAEGQEGMKAFLEKRKPEWGG